MRPESAVILVVDDEAKIRELVTRALEGRPVRTAASGAEARRLAPDAAVVLLDLRLGDADGLDLIAEWREREPELPVIVMTAFASIESAVEAMKRGARDYLTKPFVSLDALRLVVDRALAERELAAENRRLSDLLAEQDRFEEMIGDSPPMRRLYDEITRLADADATVLITGESGTGKELVARALHRRGARRRARFVAVNCAAIPATLIESELFGHEKGAFTGAIRSRRGLVEEADGGTLFLDEIGDLPPALQAKLLRVIEEKCFLRVGSSTPRRVDVRFLAATHRDLEREIEAGRFRQDLYYRLAVLRLALPPLRERGDDWFRILAALLPGTVIEPDARALLAAHTWPGNVRELKNFAERVKGMRIDRIAADQVPSLLDRPSVAITDERPLDERLADYERRLITEALAACNGVRTAAARRLGVSRQSLQYKLEKLGLVHLTAVRDPEDAAD